MYSKPNGSLRRLNPTPSRIANYVRLLRRLNQNRDRAIILAKGAQHWYYTFLYAKQDMANIDNRELAGFRELAKHYAALADEKITALIKSKELVEICHDRKK